MSHFRYRTLQDLRQSSEALGLSSVRFEEDPGKVRSILARPVPVGRLIAGNSLCIHPMEGCDGAADGSPGELTLRRYRRFARSGAKLVWFEAAAVTPEGRANPRQLWIHPGNSAAFARLLERIRGEHRAVWGGADDLIVPIQLTHSGRYSVPRPWIPCHNPVIGARTGVPPGHSLISDGDLERLEEQYTAAAGLALEAGFRCVDIKATHGYLISELLGSTTRPGKYGGPLENRVRLLRNVLARIRDRYGKQLLLSVRLGCYDGVPYQRDPETGTGVPLPHPRPYPWGFGVDRENPLREDLTEVKRLIGWLREDGVELLSVSLGCPYYNPHVVRPFEKPDQGNYETPEHPLAGVDRHFRIAGALQRAFPGLPMVGSGYTWLQRYLIHAGARNIGEGNIRFLGVGRGALAYPELCRDALEKGELDERFLCKTLTFCTFLMRQKNHPLGQFPTGCPPFDKAMYGPIMKEARAAARSAAARVEADPE